MNRIMTMAALVLAGIIGSAPAMAQSKRAQAEACRLEQLVELDIAISAQGDLLLPAKVGDRDVWVELSTASSYSLLWRAAVEHLGLKTERVNNDSVTYDNRPILWIARLPSLKLGPYGSERTFVGVAPGEAEELLMHEGRPVIGFIGNRMLSGADYELHLAKRKFRLFSRNHCPGMGAYWAKEYATADLRYDGMGTMYFPIELDGQYIEASLSTSQGASVIDPFITRKAYGFDASSPELKSAGGQGGTAYRAMSLTAPGLELSDNPIYLGRENADCGMVKRKPFKKNSGTQEAIAYLNCSGVAPLRLGREVLSKLRFYVSTKEYKIYITREDASD